MTHLACVVIILFLLGFWWRRFLGLCVNTTPKEAVNVTVWLQRFYYCLQFFLLMYVLCAHWWSSLFVVVGSVRQIFFTTRALFSIGRVHHSDPIASNGFATSSKFVVLTSYGASSYKYTYQLAFGFAFVLSVVFDETFFHVVHHRPGFVRGFHSNVVGDIDEVSLLLI